MSCFVTHEETQPFFVHPILLPFFLVHKKKTDQFGKKGRNCYKDIRKKVNETYPLIICTRRLCQRPVRDTTTRNSWTLPFLPCNNIKASKTVETKL